MNADEVKTAHGIMLKRILGFLRRFISVRITRTDAFGVAHRRWVRERGDATHRLDYPLRAESIVFDAGGYNGDWASAIYDRYGCLVHVFEPVPEFARRIAQRFADNRRITVHEFGLADADTTMDLALSADGSSVHQQSGEKISVRLRDIDAFMREHAVATIDLFKINIEGGEYALLERMLDCGIVERCGDIQVQFHDFFPDAVARRESLRQRLSLTHELTYDYYFVWENWRRRGAR